MKNTLRKVLPGLVLGLGIGLVWTGMAYAAALEYSNDTKVGFADTNVNFTIQSGSSLTTLVTNTTNIVATVPASDTFTVTSNMALTTSGESASSVLNSTCNSSNIETLIITAVSEEVVTITPGTSPCTSGSSGGGGGGGGGGAVAPPPATTTDDTTTEDDTTTPTSASTAVHPNGTLILDNGTVYLIKNGTRVGFRDEAEYLSHGYNFNQVVPATAADLALPEGSSVQKALEGTLVLDSSDGVTVYMIGTGSTKRGFTSETVFTELGYNFADLPSIDLTDYPSGDPIESGSLSHPDGALVLDANDGTTVWWIRGDTRQGFESEAVFNTYGFSFGKIVPANAADMALSEGTLVKFRDGTLVLDGGNYYLISDGQKRMFSSVDDMTARGYKAENAIVASLTNYTDGGTLE